MANSLRMLRHSCRKLMRACTDASPEELSDALDELASLPAVDVIRAPEIGLVMLRGRVTVRASDEYGREHISRPLLENEQVPHPIRPA